MKKILLTGLMLLLLTSNACAQETGACRFNFIVATIPPSIEYMCEENVTEEMCMAYGLFGGGSTWLGPGSTCEPITPPEPIQNESGACILSMGGMEGYCLDIFPEGIYARPYNMTRILCEELAEGLYSPPPEYLIDTTCIELSGACRIQYSPEVPVTEEMCKQSFGDAAVWETDTCCVSGKVDEYYGGFYIIEGFCEGIQGSFEGIGTTCTGITTSETGYCRITSGTMAGICVDETDSGDAMTEILCQEMGEFMGENYFFQANKSCSSLAGACHLDTLSSGGIDETTCLNLSSNAMWLGDVCCVPDKIHLSIFGGLTFNINQEVCENLLEGSFQGIGVSCVQPPVDPTGACILSDGAWAGVCLDESLDTHTLLTEQGCQDQAGQMGSTYEFYPGHLCADYVGACRFNKLMGNPIGEQECLDLFDNSVWLGSECCVEDELSVFGNPAFSMTELLCESLLEGVFCGIGSSCTGTTSTTQPPIQTPEYPTGAAPLLALVLAAAVISFMIKV